MIRLIAAVDSRNGIAKNGIEPWDIPSDLKYFRDLTTTHGSNVLMGYNTYKFINHPLSDRNNFILTSSHKDETIEGVIIVSDLDKFIAEFKKDLWVIGGAGTYAQTIDLADEIYLTKIDHDFSCDQFFPDMKIKTELVYDKGPMTENGLSFHFTMLKKVD